MTDLAALSGAAPDTSHPPFPGAARVLPQAVPEQAPVAGVPDSLVPAWDRTAAAPGAA